MTVIIIGAGTIGASLAEFLFDAGMDVIVVDSNKQSLLRIESALDVQTFEGNACDPHTYEQAGAATADLALAMTGNDEVNLLAAMAAKNAGAGRCVARVRQPHYLQTEALDYRRLLDIDLIVSPEVLTASAIVKFLNNPDALALDFYAQGKIQLLQVVLPGDHAFCGKALMELNLPGGVLIVLVTREGEVLIPKGGDRLAAGDKITLLGKRGTLEGMRRQFGRTKTGGIGNVVIAGGGRTGYYIADTLDRRVDSVKIVEFDEGRCRDLSARLPHATVLHGDATERNLLVEERIGKADVFVAALSNDEDNIMASLMARHLGAGKCIAIVKKPDYTPLLIENTAIDLALSPRQITAERILSVVKRGAIKNVSLLENGLAEVVEFTAGPGAGILNTPLKDLKLPAGCLAGMIQRGKGVRIPSGDDAIHENDTVIMVMLAGVAAKVESLF